MSEPQNHLLSADELRAALAELSTWTAEEGRLRKRFVFPDFAAALAFMVRVGFEAEHLCHHPNWSNVYNRVEVELWSHDLGGISALCVALARVMDHYAQ